MKGRTPLYDAATLRTLEVRARDALGGDAFELMRRAGQAAWQEALQLMRPGDEWILYVPPELGYGAEGAGGGEIPGGAALIFKIELIDFLPGPGRVQQG